MKLDFLYKKIEIPLLFRLLHGKDPRLYEILITYLAACLASLFIYPIINQSNFPALSKMLLIFLTLDLAGGLVANSTSSTSAFYSQHPELRKVYLWIHFLHPTILAFLFPNDLSGIALISIITLGAAFWFHARRNYPIPMEWLALLLLAVLLITFLFPFHYVALQLLLLFYFFKMQVSVLLHDSV